MTEKVERVILGPVGCGFTDVVGHDMLFRTFGITDSVQGQIELDLDPESLNRLFRLQVIFTEGESRLSGLGSFERRGVQLKKIFDDERANRLVREATSHLEKMRSLREGIGGVTVNG